MSKDVLFLGDNDIASMYVHQSLSLDNLNRGTQPITPVEPTFDSPQEEFLARMVELHERFDVTPAHRRQTEHAADIVWFVDAVKHLPQYVKGNLHRYISYTFEWYGNTPHLPIGIYTDAGIINQSHPFVKASKQQFGRRWRHGLVHIFALAD